jgi:N-acyl homoserine lactone hydrolase
VRDLFFLTSGSFKAVALAITPLGRLRGRRAFQPLRMSNTVAVVVRDNGDVVLVDAGWSREACAAPLRTIGVLQVRVLGVEVKHGDALVDQLAMLGIARDRVKTVVATHMHLDHVGGIVDFPDAELVCSDVELSAARVRPAAGGYRPADIETARLRPVTLTAGPSYGFPASFDLFGDGEIVLLDANGHTAGQVAVAMRARGNGALGPGACYVHVGDAAYQTWEWGLSPAGPCAISRATAWRLDLLRLRYSSLRDCEVDPRRPVLVPSHDADVYARLPHAPSDAGARAAE